MLRWSSGERNTVVSGWPSRMPLITPYPSPNSAGKVNTRIPIVRPLIMLRAQGELTPRNRRLKTLIMVE